MTRMARVVQGAVLITVLTMVPATAQVWNCLPSCATADGRFISTTASGFSNFGVEGYKLVARLTVPSVSTSLLVGVFDPDDCGPVDGQYPGDVVGYWDADWGQEPLVLSYRLCADADRDYQCDGAPLQELRSTELVLYDNDWFDFAPLTGSLTYLLEIEPDVQQQSATRWNSFKLRVQEPAAMYLPPQPLAFGVPVTSCADLDVIYPQPNGGTFCETSDTSNTTYDGNWDFRTIVEPPINGTPLEIRDLTIWDGDWDFGSWPQTSGPPEEVCFPEGAGDPTYFDDDDLNTGSNDFPPHIPPNPDPEELDKNGILREGGGAISRPGEECFKLGSPPDDWPLPDAGTYRRSPSGSISKHIGYLINDLVGREFLNLNASGNQEWERFAIEVGSLCGGDHCVDDPLPIGPYAVSVEGVDVLNFVHFYASICVDSDLGTCLECSACAGRVTQMTLRFNGLGQSQVEVVAKLGAALRETVFDGTVDPGEEFTFLGPGAFGFNGTLGMEIEIFVDGVLHTSVATDCSAEVGTGYVSGDFEVVWSYSRGGGQLCPVGSTPPKPSAARRRSGRR